MAHPDLPAEQAYLDHAYVCLDRMRETLLRTAGAGATEVAAEAIEAWATRRLRSYEDAERALCFGRIDVGAADDALYVGRRWVDDDDGTVVVNWQAPAARPFYTATPFEPHGVTLRRRFRTQGRKDDSLNRFLDTLWPAPRPEQVVRQLLTSRERLAAASEGILDAGEQTLLRRARSGWSSADLPLLDEARAVLHGAPIQYGHVIVDEGQDLTPMQLRMIARRTAGSFTILGDVAQATGPIPYGRWEELLAFLPGRRPR